MLFCVIDYFVCTYFVGYCVYAFVTLVFTMCYVVFIRVLVSYVCVVFVMYAYVCVFYVCIFVCLYRMGEVIRVPCLFRSWSTILFLFNALLLFCLLLFVYVHVCV